MRGYLFILSILALSACARTDPYPICVLDSNTMLFGEWDQVEEKLISSAEAFVGSPDSVALSTGNRFMIIRTDSGTHERLRDIWPQMACVTREPVSSHDDFVTCVMQMSDWFEQGNIGMVPFEPVQGGIRTRCHQSSEP